MVFRFSKLMLLAVLSIMVCTSSQRRFQEGKSSFKYFYKPYTSLLQEGVHPAWWKRGAPVRDDVVLYVREIPVSEEEPQSEVEGSPSPTPGRISASAKMNVVREQETKQYVDPEPLDQDCIVGWQVFGHRCIPIRCLANRKRYMEIKTECVCVLPYISCSFFNLN